MQKRFSRIFLMTAGILTVLVILLSQSFYRPDSTKVSKAKTGQSTKEQSADKIIANAPADVVASPAVQLNENTPTLVKTLTLGKLREKNVFPVVRIFTSFLDMLFRTLISPNAP